MGREKRIDTNLLDKAILFATNAHKGAERRGKGFPYIVHPLEVTAIVSTMTNDQELLAAAVLHDTVEDTDTSIDDIRREFGDRVADIVDNESDKLDPNIPEADSWKERKQAAINRLKDASLDSKMVALGDKLSNMRALNQDFKVMGDELWNKFHNNDPREHEWHYRGLADSLIELRDTEAYKEFVRLIDETFIRAGRLDFKFEINANKVALSGVLNRENSLKLEEAITKKGLYRFDFEYVYEIDFAGLRTLVRMFDNGYRMVIENACKDVAHMFYSTGVSNKIKIAEGFTDFDIRHAEISGDGYTAVSYFVDDNDSMLKLYIPSWNKDEIFNEKRSANAAMLMGLPTPFSGELVKVGDRYGITFERVLTKKSISRMLADNPEKLDELAKLFAGLCVKLHTTKCDTDVFPTASDAYKKEVAICKAFSEDEKAKIYAYIDSIPQEYTCVHGDLHIGNVIITDKGEALFIDMGDFCYGNPMFDLSMFYFVTHGRGDATIMRIFHNSCETMRAFWDKFIKYYLGTDDNDVIREYEEKLMPFVALKAVWLGNRRPDFPEHFMKLIKEYLLK